MINKLIKNYFFRQLLSQLRGAKKLRDKEDPFFVAKIVSSLDTVHLGLDQKDFPTLLIGKHTLKTEILLRQILLFNYAKICCDVMQSIGKAKPLSTPLPVSWVTHLTNHGIKHSAINCRKKLLLFSLKRTIVGLIKFLILLSQRKNQIDPGYPYAAFMGLNQNNLPSSRQKKSYDFISWYKQSKIKNNEIKRIWVETKIDDDFVLPLDITVTDSIFPKLNGAKEYLRFLINGIAAFIVAVFGIMRGKWWYGCLFPEAINLHYINNISRNNLAFDYYFFESNWFYKPLWTYEVESKGSNVNLCFYSTNSMGIGLDNNNWLPITYGLRIMKWNTFVVWNAHQKDAIKQYCPKARFYIVGFVDFTDNGKAINVNNSKFKIAIFDVNATRPVKYTSLGYAIAPYWSQKLVLQFFSDIEECIDHSKITLLWKQKRHVNKRFVSRAYFSKRDLITKKHFIEIHPDISARKLIEVSDAVLSIPFTSTSLIGMEIGKPSIYYDPSGTVMHRRKTDVPIIKTKENLFKWCQEIVLIK